MEMWHGTLWILKYEDFNSNKLLSTGKVINELLFSLFQVSRKIQRCCWMLGFSSYISVPASLNWHARHMKGCNPLGDSPVTQPALSPHSPGSPCHSLLERCSYMLLEMKNHQLPSPHSSSRLICGVGILLLLNTARRTISVISEAQSIHCSPYFSFPLITNS